DFTLLLPDNSIKTKKLSSYGREAAGNRPLGFYDDVMKAVPLTRKNRHLNIWFDYLPEQKAVYMRYRNVSNNDDETTVVFTKKLFSFIDSAKAQKLIVDLRDNTGGNSFLNQPLIAGILNSHLSKQKGGIFCLVNQLTFSAAINFLQQVDNQTPAIVVGEPTADAPNFCSDIITDSLPNTKYRVALSTLQLLNSFEYDYRKSYDPDVTVADFTWAEFNNNTDRMLNCALNYKGVNNKIAGSKNLDKALGKYQYTAIKPASITKESDGYWLKVPGEISTQLKSYRSNVFATDNTNLQLFVRAGNIVLLNNSKPVVQLRKISESELMPYELVESGKMQDAITSFTRVKNENPQMLFLIDANISLHAYQLYFLQHSGITAYRFLEVGKALHPESGFSNNTKDLIKQAESNTQTNF
ncbi:MAG: hypothetical protein ICV66_14130, partial [Chitinophagaceae bacterium]|nr:hypothetical protein [Chitinophagaceae bacterium]